MAVGPEMIHLTQDVVMQIRERMRLAQDRQRSYADYCQCEVHFDVGDYVLLKVSLTKGNIRFDTQGKLNLHYIGRFDVL